MKCRPRGKEEKEEEDDSRVVRNVYPFTWRCCCCWRRRRFVIAISITIRPWPSLCLNCFYVYTWRRKFPFVRVSLQEKLWWTSIARWTLSEMVKLEAWFLGGKEICISGHHFMTDKHKYLCTNNSSFYLAFLAKSLRVKNQAGVRKDESKREIGIWRVFRSTHKDFSV